MNKWILRLLAGVAVTGAAGGAGASSTPSITPDAEAWERTVAANTLEAYAKFSLDFPDSEFARKARLKLTVLATSETEAEEDVPSNEPAKGAEPDFVPSSIMVV